MTRTMGHTVQFIIISEVLALILGIAVGIYSAIRQYSVFDYTFTGIGFLGFAMPTFWLALLLQMCFTDIYDKWNVRIFYTSGLNSIPGGRRGPGTGCSISRCRSDAPHHQLRALQPLHARLDAGRDQQRLRPTARAKGVSEWRVIMRHVFRNALIPITTVAALNFGALIGGAIVTETVFSLDGFGYWFVQARRTWTSTR